MLEEMVCEQRNELDGKERPDSKDNLEREGSLKTLLIKGVTANGCISYAKITKMTKKSDNDTSK